jgi:hypothetical protein
MLKRTPDLYNVQTIQMFMCAHCKRRGHSKDECYQRKKLLAFKKHTKAKDKQEKKALLVEFENYRAQGNRESLRRDFQRMDLQDRHITRKKPTGPCQHELSYPAGRGGSASSVSGLPGPAGQAGFLRGARAKQFGESCCPGES